MNEIGAQLNIEVTYATSKEREKSLAKEVETLKTLLDSQEQDLEYKMCSICQEQVRMKIFSKKNFYRQNLSV